MKTNPIVHSLRIAARDNTPARVLKTCEHILSSMGWTGPTARRIEMLFGIQTAGSKIIHCALHKYHREAGDLDSAFTEFKSRYCDSCPDRSPRPADWKYSEAFQEQFNAKHLKFVADFNATGAGYRFHAFRLKRICVFRARRVPDPAVFQPAFFCTFRSIRQPASFQHLPQPFELPTK